MQPPEEDFMKKYYTDEAWAKRIAIRTQTSNRRSALVFRADSKRYYWTAAMALFAGLYPSGI
jgi:hypothetical protein